MRTFRVLLACLFFSAFAVGESPASGAVSLTPRQALAKSRVAKTKEDYQELARFYRQQKSLFTAAYKQQQQAYNYAMSHWGSKSYPQSADRARLLGDYYKQRSSESQRLADAYTQKAEFTQHRSGLDAAPKQ